MLPPLCIATLQGASKLAHSKDLKIPLPRLDRQIGFIPFFPAADQGLCIFITGMSEFLHHTGACGFIVSGTIGNQPHLRTEAQFPCSFHNVVGGHPDPSPGLRVASLKTAFRPHI